MRVGAASKCQVRLTTDGIVQARGSMEARALLDRFQQTEPVAPGDAFTYCAPVPASLSGVNTTALTNSQFDLLLNTHLGDGILYAAGVEDGLVVPTNAPGQSLSFRLTDPMKPGVKALGSRVPFSNVVGVDIDSCAGPIHVIDSVLIPRGLEGVAVADEDGEADAPVAYAPGGACVLTVVAANQAGGGGLITAVELAVVRTPDLTCARLCL